VTDRCVGVPHGHIAKSAGSGSVATRVDDAKIPWIGDNIGEQCGLEGWKEAWLHSWRPRQWTRDLEVQVPGGEVRRIPLYGAPSLVRETERDIAGGLLSNGGLGLGQKPELIDERPLVILRPRQGSVGGRFLLASRRLDRVQMIVGGAVGHYSIVSSWVVHYSDMSDQKLMILSS